MTKDKPVYFAFYPDDWIGGTRHYDHVTRACYLDLLLFQFENGHIPDDPLTRMQLCGIVDVGQWQRIWLHISDKFEVGDDGKFRNVKMDRERSLARKRYESAATRGRKGGQAKASSARNQLEPGFTNQNQNQNQNESQKNISTLERRKIKLVKTDDTEEIVKRIGSVVPVSGSNDFWLVRKIAACVVCGRISESSIYHVLETMSSQRGKICNDAAYLRGALRNRLEMGRQEFDDLLKSVTLTE